MRLIKNREKLKQFQLDSTKYIKRNLLTLQQLNQINTGKFFLNTVARHMRQIRTDLPTLKSPSITPSNKQVSTNNSRTLFNQKRYLKPALTQEDIKQIKDVFDVFDTQGRGLVNPQELIQSLNSVGYKAKENTTYQHLLDLAADGCGQIDFDKFLTMMTTKVTEEDSRQDMNQLFSLFDDQKSGYLSVMNLRRLIRQMGIDLQEHQLQKMIQVADFDKDGRVSQQQFYNFMTNKN